MTSLLFLSLLPQAALGNTDFSSPVHLGSDAVLHVLYSERDDPSFVPNDLGAPVDLDLAQGRAAELTPQTITGAAIEIQDALAVTEAGRTEAISNGVSLLDTLLSAAVQQGVSTEPMVDSLLALANESQDGLVRRQVALVLWRHEISDPRLDTLVAQLEQGNYVAEDALLDRSIQAANALLWYAPAFSPMQSQFELGEVYEGSEQGYANVRESQAADGSATYLVDTSSELGDMARTLRHALVTQAIARHLAERRGWEDERVEAAAFLAGAAIYDNLGGIGWRKYRDFALPGTEIELEQASRFLEGESLKARQINDLAQWAEAIRDTVTLVD